MKRTVLGGIVSVLLIFTAVLIMYLLVAKSTSSFRIQEFDSTVAFMTDRIEAMEKQRDLLKDSAAAMEKELGVLNKRVRQIDVEIQSMRDLIGSAKTSIKGPLFSWKKLQITAGSSVMMIAFLALIWLLYSTFIKSGTSDGEKDEESSALPAVDGEATEEPLTGSVLEEEYPLASDAGGSEVEPAQDESAGGGEELKEKEDEPPVAVESEESEDEETRVPDSESPSSDEEPGEMKE